MVYLWRCSRCATFYQPDQVLYSCPACGDDAALDLAIDYARFAGASMADLLDSSYASIWRYRRLLPLESDFWDRTADRLAQVAIGWTPLVPAARLGAQLGLSRLWIKDDGRNQTGSLKDRASALVVAKALELGKSTIAAASTGNAAASLAGINAAIGLRSIIFVPQTALPAKVAQLLVYGAQVLLVAGSYDDAFDLCLAACREHGWYCRNTAYNPYTAEGKKTVAFEIIEQCGGHAPDTVIVPTGDGNILTGVYRGFEDALRLGWIRRMPRLIGVQAQAASALYQAWQAGAADVTAAPAETIADSLNIGLPRDGFRALRAVRATGGQFVAVSEEALLDAIGVVARTTGIFVEPASAVGFAGLLALREQGVLQADEQIVVLNTGNGLKDVQAAIRSLPVAPVIEPSLEALQKIMPRLT